MKNYVVGIDLGGTKISCALADLEGNVKAQHTTPTNAHEGEQAVLDRIIGCVSTISASYKLPFRIHFVKLLYDNLNYSLLIILFNTKYIIT